MKNELTLYNNINKQLQERRKENIFPLSATHRKELRELKKKNIGNLYERMRSIKEIKLNEFKALNKSKIDNKIKNYEAIVLNLNSDWLEIQNKIILILKARKEYESSFDLTQLELNTDYESFANLNYENSRREYNINKNKLFDDISRKLFDEIYMEAFKNCSSMIDKIESQYEEAINFGDLEIVKKLYYIMKSSEDLFDKIKNLNVKGLN